MEEGFAGIKLLAHAPPIVLGLIFVALAFDFINGFHDAANSIATVVSTRVLSPRLAVYWAAFFNFVAVFIFGTAVACCLSAGFVIVRKPGKLPHKRVSKTYDLEYGTDTLEMHADAIVKGHARKAGAAVVAHLDDVERRMVEQLL